MGFFSVFKKIGKGFKSAFKSIGKGIKSAFKKFGKFMGKIGIVGQLAMMFVLPGIGAALSKTVGGAFSGLLGKGATMAASGTSATVTAGTGMLGSTSAIVRGAGQVLKAAGNFTKMAHAGYKTVTGGIGSFVSEYASAAVNAIPGAGNFLKTLTGGRLNITDAKFSTAWGKVSETVVTNAQAVMKNFDNLIGNVAAPTSASIAGQLSNAKAVTGTGTTPVGTAGVKPSGVMDIGDIKGAVTNVDTSKSFFDKLKAPTPLAESSFKSGYDVSGMRISSKASESLLSRAGDAVVDYGKALPGKALERAKKEIAAIPKRLGDYAIDTLEDKLIEKVVGKEEVEQSYGGSSFVGYQSAGISDYGSPEIQDRAYQYNSNPSQFMMQNPMGYSAQSYSSRMQGSYASLPAIG